MFIARSHIIFRKKLNIICRLDRKCYPMKMLQNLSRENNLDYTIHSSIFHRITNFLSYLDKIIIRISYLFR